MYLALGTKIYALKGHSVQAESFITAHVRQGGGVPQSLVPGLFWRVWVSLDST